MHFRHWTTAALVLATEFSLSSAKAIMFTPSLRRSTDDTVDWKRASAFYEGDLERPGVQPSRSNLDRRSPQSSNTESLSLDAPGVEMNTTIATTCSDALSGVTTVNNQAGLGVCYNILDWHPNTGMFQADLRLFQLTPPGGDFQNIPMGSISVLLTYPASTQFQSLMKRSLASADRVGDVKPRQTARDEVQQYSLAGMLKMHLDLGQLNNTELMSLMIPQITLQATSQDDRQTTLSTNTTTAESAFFVTGQFSDQVTPQIAAQAADPVMAASAISASRGFVLPGTTFGIFPTGLIVTGTWTVLFLVAFGVGTFGRIRHRNMYRRRMAAQASTRR